MDGESIETETERYYDGYYDGASGEIREKEMCEGVRPLYLKKLTEKDQAIVDKSKETMQEWQEKGMSFPHTKAKEAATKPRPSLLPMHALSEVVDCMTKGAVKYGDHNWRECENGLYLDALGRHFMAYARGELCDEEGTAHLAAIVCNALILLEKERGL